VTAQDPDELALDGQTWRLLATPLDGHLAAVGARFTAPNTGNFRGYVASWAVQDNRLWLMKVHGWQVVSERVRGLGGLLDLPPNTESAALPDCRGLLFAAEPLDLLAGSVEPGRWFVDEDGRTAVLVTDPALADGLARHREGHLICGANRFVLAGATVLPRERIWSAEELSGYSVDVPGEARPATESWVRCPEDAWHGFSGYPEERVSDSAWFRTSPPPWPPSMGPPAERGPSTWPVEELVVSRRTVVEKDLSSLGPDPLPMVADFVSGSLRIGAGKLERYVHHGFESRWEREATIVVERGVVRDVRPSGEG
jgi:hypothetical protein